MNSLESFLESYERNLDSIIVGGGWAVEIFQDRAQNPRREHHDIDTLVLDENLDVENDSHPVLGEYFWSIDVESVDWLREFIVEKQVTCKDKTYDVKVLCPEFIVVSKAFARLGAARDKDNEDIMHIFDTIDLDKEKIYSLIEKAELLREGSCFLDVMEEKGLETVKYSRDDFNKKLFKKKFNIKKIPRHITNQTIGSYDLLLSQIKKGFGTKWIKNNKKQIKKILNKNDALKAESYGEAIRDALMNAKESMKEDLVDSILIIPDTKKARTYGVGIRYALEYAEDGMKADLADRILSIPDSQKADNYGWAVRNALMYAEEDMKEDLAEKILDSSNAQKAEKYGWEIRTALDYNEKDTQTQQNIINRILRDQNE